jgi:hypothetical protein
MRVEISNIINVCAIGINWAPQKNDFGEKRISFVVIILIVSIFY